MLTSPLIDPVAFSLGPIDIHWYGLMYLVAFLAGWGLGALRAPSCGWKSEEIADLLFYVAMGVIIGGRLGYVFFYKPGEFFDNPAFLFAIQRGGMSFHGGLLGVLVGMAVYARKTNRSFFAVTDFLAPLVPTGLLAGRIGNFINGELWGAPTTAPWGVVFEGGGDVARHPSQLYEAGLEGVALFILLWLYARKPKPVMAVSGLFLIGYGAGRFAVEFVREPDEHLGYLAFDWLTMGQVLTAPMLIGGLVLMVIAYQRRVIENVPAPANRADAPSGGDSTSTRRKPAKTGKKRKRR
jgi:phosphatidylglycerol---prolipoprotein diacylglyceryl transferase